MNWHVVGCSFFLLVMWLTDSAGAHTPVPPAQPTAADAAPEEPVRPNDINALLGYPDLDSRAHFSASRNRP